MMKTDLKQKKIPPAIGFGYLLAGLVFLSNPYFTLLDILPDAIGYALILHGLGKTVFAVPSFGDAVKKIKILIGISIVRFVFFFMVASMPHLESQTMSLMTVFCLILAEGYIAWQTVRIMFEGIARTCQLPGGEEHAKKLPFLRGFTRFFLIFRLLCNLLPELAILRYSEEGFIGAATENPTLIWLQFRNVLAVLLFLAVLLLALPFFLCWRSWLVKVRKNKPFRRSIAGLIKENPEKEGRNVCRNVKNASICFFAGSICLWSLQLDGVFWIPICFGTALLGAACFFLSKLQKDFKVQTWLWMLIATPLALVCYVSKNLFVAKYYARGTARGGQGWMTANITLSAVYGVCVLALLFLFAKGLQKLIAAHCFDTVDPALVRTSIETENRKAALRRRVLWLAFAALPVMLCEILEQSMLFAPEMSFTVLKAKKTISFWGIFLLIRAAWIAFSILTVSRIKIHAEEKYNENG